MEIFSPKLEIINHFDDLIHKVDIDIEEKKEKYNENQLLEELECFKVENRNRNVLKFRDTSQFDIEFIKSFESSDENKEQTVDQWSESTKVVDYLNQIQMTTIEELRKEQKESVENSSRFNSLINSELTKEEKRSELFAEKFYFQVKITRSDIKSWVFNLFTFVTEFYISQSDIDLLQNIINAQVTNETQNHIFDEKMIQIGLLYKYFCDNLNNHKFPSHMIQVFKNDVSKIQRISFYYNISEIKLNCLSIDLSKLKFLRIISESALDYIIIDSLYSLEYLHLDFTSVKEISIKNLYALKDFRISSNEIINIQTDLFDQLPNIESLSYRINWMNKLSYLNFLTKSNFNKHDKCIVISQVKTNINLDLFMDKYCNEIEKFKIRRSNIENITKLLSEYQFKNLVQLGISSCSISKLEKKLFDGFETMIRKLNIKDNENLEIIDYDVFSNFKQLVSLDLSHNCIESLDRRLFSGLVNLERLYLDRNRLKRLDDNIFSDLKNLKMLDLSCNQLEKFDFKSIFGLENLNKLNLSHNKLINIDHDVFLNLKQLVYLDLRCNSIESLDFSGLIYLETLYLSSNRLKRIDENLFSYLENLKKLNLSSNELETVDSKSFVGLENLNELNLSQNKLENIDHDVFLNLKQLVYLDLSYNSIESLDRRLFSGLINLENLDLSCNLLRNLNFLEVQLLDNLPRLENIDLFGNTIFKKEFESLNLSIKKLIYY